MKTIDLRIERIVIDGVTLTPIERARLRTALEAQLSDRLSRATHGLEAMHAQHGEAALRAPLLMPAAATPGQWGRGIADAVLGSLTSGTDASTDRAAAHHDSPTTGASDASDASGGPGAAARSSSSIASDSAASTSGGAR